jgi:hypothetical protein
MSSTTPPLSYVAMSTPETSASSLGMPLGSPALCARCSTGSAPTPRFRVILFTVDETTAGNWRRSPAPSVRLGAPWWFLDSPEGMRRFREFAVETAGFYNTSGFVDDTPRVRVNTRSARPVSSR